MSSVPGGLLAGSLVPVTLAPILASVLVAATMPSTMRAQDVERPSPSIISDSLIARGRAVFSGPARCVSCHGEGGRGSDVAPDLTDDKWIRGTGTFEEIVERVVHGVTRRQSSSGTPMPMRGWNPASDADVRAVAAYVWSLSHQRRH